jgi:multimeric flavodoxin WrbA
MKVIGIVGSPRKGGNTDTLVRQALTGAHAAGAETAVIYLNDMVFQDCQGCGYCKGTNVCRLKDDMYPVYEDLISADGLVIGSPVYFGQMTGNTKSFIDRWYALVNPDFTSRLPPGKKVVLIFPQGDANPAMYEGMATHFEVTMTFFGLKVTETIIAPGLLAAEEVQGDEDLMRRAFAAGKSLAE